MRGCGLGCICIEGVLVAVILEWKDRSRTLLVQL
jgi:hypothetical protein